MVITSAAARRCKMKKSCGFFFWSLAQCEFCLCSSLKECCRHLSSLRVAPELQRSASIAVSSAPKLLLEKSVSDPLAWWDNRLNKRNPNYPDFNHSITGDDLLDDSSVEGRLRLGNTTGTCRASWQPVFENPAHSEDSRRLAKYVEDLKVGTWTPICEEGELEEVIEALSLLVEQGCKVHDSLFYCALIRCRVHKNLILGRHVHNLAVKSGFESNLFLANHVIGMYASHGKLEEAMQVFTRVPAPNSYMWASIILAHARLGQPTEAINLYHQMQESTLKPDNHIFVAVLKACASAKDLASGREVHADIVRKGDQINMFVGNCLVHMYAKCGSLKDARRVFDSLLGKDVVTWTAMLAGYTQQGLGKEALDLYADMQDGGISPSDHTFVCILKACASVGALCEGKELHAQILERGLDANMYVGNCLVDMYGKCGRLEDARAVFDKLPTRNVVTWNALLNGYSQNGDAQMAMQCFGEMQQQGIKPDDFTFACVLVACSHEGLVYEGWQYFKMLVEDSGIAPTVYHYNCMIDLLGRAGSLDAAEDMLHKMPFENNIVGWTSLLTACKSNGDLECGRRCFDNLVKLEPDNATAYALLGSIYARAGRWGDVDRIDSLRKYAGAKKLPAKACIEVKRKVCEFTVGEERSDVSSRLRRLNLRLKEEGGHVPHTELVLKAVSDTEKEAALCGHAEKLALAYGLLNTADGTPLLVTKNLRMCNDCHSATKIMSRLERRDIVVRDAHRVHRFVDGSCSCGDVHC